jgi:hypothetical protein
MAALRRLHKTGDPRAGKGAARNDWFHVRLLGQRNRAE